jgi:hypothetical protein
MIGLKDVVKIYKSRGFSVDLFLGDGEFEPLRGNIAELGGTLNTTANDEHVGDVERYIRTIKERARATLHLTPFRQIPVIMVQDLIGGCVFWLNSFPNENGVSRTVSPRTIMTGKTVDYNRHCKIMFGAYAQVHEEHDNSMQARTTGAIALRPTGNEQGGFYFMSLATGRRLNRNHWHELPMPQDVVDRVEVLARRSFASQDLVFQFHDGAPVDDDDESAADPAYEPEDDDDHESDGDDVEYDDEQSAGDDHDEDEQSANDDRDEIDDAEANHDENNEENAANLDNADDIHAGVHGNNDEIAGVDGNDDEIAEVTDDHVDELLQDDASGEDEPTVANDTNAMDAMDDNIIMETEDHPDRSHGYDLRPRKPRSYKHRHPDLEDVMMTQLSLRKVLQTFGEAGAQAVSAELQQIHDRAVMVPKAANMLTREEKLQALRYLMYLKKKRCGRIKGRGCADGRKQRVYKTKEESSSPTVAIESLFLTAVIDAKEERDVVTCDIPGAFMHADMDEVVHMRIDGPMARLLVKIDPKLYEPYLTYEKGTPVIYVKLVKALYGTLQAALLFWQNLTDYLMEIGFELNPYDECVANKIINGKQCTIVWHVDDLKISHEDSAVTASIVDLLQQKYGSDDAPLTVTYGKVHDYLGMTLDYSNKGKVIIDMKKYTTELLNDLPDDMQDGVAVTQQQDICMR